MYVSLRWYISKVPIVSLEAGYARIIYTTELFCLPNVQAASSDYESRSIIYQILIEFESSICSGELLEISSGPLRCSVLSVDDQVSSSDLYKLTFPSF